MKGPTITTIPTQVIKSCRGYDYHSHTLVKSGIIPIYKDDCVNAGAPKIHLFDFKGNLRSNGFAIEPGDWCPFK